MAPQITGDAFHLSAFMVAKGLFALCEILFVLQKKYVNMKPFLVQSIFCTQQKFSQVQPIFEDAGN